MTIISFALLVVAVCNCFSVKMLSLVIVMVCDLSSVKILLIDVVGGG